MSTLQQDERAIYEAMWAVPAYGDYSPGAQHVPLFQAMSGASSGSVLDAGTGSGRGALALRDAGFTVRLCDMTNAGLVPEARGLDFHQVILWQSLRREVGFVDWVYCCDVLEHLPTALVGLTVARLLEVARRGVFLSVAFTPDAFGAWVGRPLHQTVQPFVWWRDVLAEVGSVREARDLLDSGVFLVTPC